MKNLQTGTTCLSSSTGSKQHKCRRSLQRLATFVILFLCSMTVSWAQETTTKDKTFGLVIENKAFKQSLSKDEAITATCSGNGVSLQDNNVKFAANGTGNLTITANAATISKIELMVSKNNTKPKDSIEVTSNTTSIDVPDGKTEYRQMPVKWNGKTSVTFSCGTQELRVFGATIYYP